MKTYAEIRKIDVSDHLEKKGNLSYLSWAWAIDTLLQNDPDATWEHPEERVFPDETVMVFAVVKAFGKERKAHLPVMNHKNEPIKKPNAFQINTALQRCLVKAIALHGLGLYVYAGEDLPEAEETNYPDKKQQRDYFYALALTKTAEDVSDLKAEWVDYTFTDAMSDGTESRIQGLKRGVTFPPAVYGYVDTQEAVDFAIEAGKYIEKETDLDELHDWMHKNDHKLKALDKILTAAKYIKNGETTYKRLANLYLAKTNPLAAE
ncbi:Single-strand annealing protein SAK3 [uncultured Caudovirales phage]|uniref:Single-strand annealing protein SAK3 n=1 Tax=uncultured Caudovirales phage TaxID=2100421 RepID=A0A6J5M0K3_9CAUD|nr:Single-strand annealing protein SAK3 [uncultured Caudovirales phage]